MQIHYVFRASRYFSALLLLLVFSSSSKTVHPFFVSVTEIRSDTQQKSLNISCRMFTDDLQDALYETYRYKADLSKRDAQTDPYLSRYIAEHLRLTVAAKPVVLQFIGFEIEEEATWCYFEAASFPGNGQMEVVNRLLYDFLPEQTNLIHFYRNGQRSSFKLVNPEEKVVFE